MPWPLMVYDMTKPAFRNGSLLSLFQDVGG